MKTKIMDWICGYYPGQNHYSFWWGFRFGMGTRRGRVAHLVICEWGGTLMRLPQPLRLSLADRLSRMVARLRKQKVHVHGWGSYAIGNRAADLRDQIETALIGRMDLDAYYDEVCEQLTELASIAEAVTWRNREIFRRSNRVESDMQQGQVSPITDNDVPRAEHSPSSL